LAIGRTELAGDREQARQEADAARVVAETTLYRSLLGQAAAVRTARSPGYRREVWQYLHQARALQVPVNNPAEIRHEVLACLGDPIGLDPIDFPTVERIPPVPVPEHFQSIIDQMRTQQESIVTAVSADGRWLAACGFKKTEITLWDADGNVAGKASTPLGPIVRLALSRDGQTLVAGCDGGTVVLSAPDLQLQTFFRGVPLYRSLAIHPKGHLLATLDWVFKIEIWSLRSNRLIAAMMAPAGVQTIEYSADGRLLLGVARDRRTIVRGWPMDATPERRTLHGHQAAVNGVAFSPDGSRLASASHDGAVRIWDAATGALLCDCRAHRDYVQTVRFSPDGRWLCSASWDGFVMVWDAISGERVAAAHVPTDLWDAEFDSSMRLLAAAGSNRLDVWEFTATANTASLQPVKTVDLNQRGVDVAFRPGTSTAVVLLQSTMELLQCDVARDDPPQRLDARPFVGFYTLHFDRSGERLFFRSADGPLGVWDTRRGRASYMRTTVPAGFHAFTADSRWLAAPDEYPYQVRVFDLSADRELFALPQGPQNKSVSLAWSPDASRLAVGSNEGEIAIWDMEEVAARLREFGLDIQPPNSDPSADQGQQWDRLAADYARRLEALPVALGTNAPRKRVCLEAVEQDELFQRLIRLCPDDPQLWVARGRHHVQRQEWTQAAEAYANVIDGHPIDDEHVEYACLLAIQHDQAALERFLKRTAERTDAVLGPFEWYVLTRAASVAPQGAVPSADAVKWGQDAVAKEGHAWFCHALALAHYRAGQFDQALAQARESDARDWGPGGRAVNALVRAMTHQQLGQPELARMALAEARESMAREPRRLMPELLTSRLLFAEAEELLQAGEPPAKEATANGRPTGLTDKNEQP
jgi:WD40 repeat protein